MRISQAYISKSISDFPFLESYSLSDYNDITQPCLFIGCYRYEDKMMIRNHHGVNMILWTGQDALDYDWGIEEINRSVHVTAHPKIYNKFIDKGLQIQYIAPNAFMYKKEVQQLGTKVYAYCPNQQEYHGWSYIKKLIEIGYEVVVGAGIHTQDEWKNFKHGYYNDCFVGLCLSPFAGGAGSVVEMGLRGMNVITNVLELPNCHKWETIEDIVYLIEENKKRIGMIDEQLAQKVFESLDHKNEWLNI